MTESRSNQSGFTIIELLVTIVVSTIFILAIYQVVLASLVISRASSQYTIASNLAYANLRHYVDGQSAVLWFECQTSNETSPQTVLSQTGTIPRLSGTVTQTVTATALYGCSGNSIGMPVRVESSVTYGVAGAQKVSHTSYAGY